MPKHRSLLTISRVSSSEEVEVAVKVGHVVVFQNIASYAQFKKGRSRNEGGEAHLDRQEREEPEGLWLRTRRAEESKCTRNEDRKTILADCKVQNSRPNGLDLHIYT
jgi:hypothetical protein